MTFLKRLQKIFTPPVADVATAALYSSCIAQARQELFYRDLGVPDTVDGRFDMLLLHVVLVMRRLGDQAALKQSLFDLMFADMERSLREMGVGDMSISKKVRPMIQAFYGRAQAYEKALVGIGETLAEVVQRNLYGNVRVEADSVQRMTDYVQRTAAMLDQQKQEDLLAGRVVFDAAAT